MKLEITVYHLQTVPCLLKRTFEYKMPFYWLIFLSNATINSIKPRHLALQVEYIKQLSCKARVPVFSSSSVVCLRAPGQAA